MEPSAAVRQEAITDSTHASGEWQPTELLQCCLDAHPACSPTCVLRLRPAPRHEFPQWRCQDLSKIFPTLEEAGIDLLKVMLEYDPAKRITVSTAAASCCLLLGLG